jgi:hypothetical protein
VYGAIGSAIQSFTRLKPQWDGALARQIDDFLKALATGATRDQHPIDGPAGAQSLAYRVEPSHDWAGRVLASCELYRSARVLRRRLFGLMFRNY